MNNEALPLPTAGDIAAALSVIPPRPDYQTWLEIASAVWSVLPMAEGCAVLNAWSPEEKAGEYASKHRHRLEKIRIGTLFYHAGQYGYKPNGKRPSMRPTAPAAAPSIRTEDRPPMELPNGVHLGNADLYAELAKGRRLPGTAGIELLVSRWILCFAEMRDAKANCPAWILTDESERNAQARRMDGEPWQSINAKAKTLKHALACWPIGILDAVDRETVLLVEGGPDMLAAATIAATAAPDHLQEIGFACMTGAANSIPDDALLMFAGKRVRIYAHADDAGRKAADRWRDQLQRAGAALVEVWQSDIEGQDLNDVLSTGTDPAALLPDLSAPLPVAPPPVSEPEPSNGDGMGKFPPWIEQAAKLLEEARHSPGVALSKQDDLFDLFDSIKHGKPLPRPLPSPVCLKDVTEEDMRPPPVLVKGMLYQGGKMLLSGVSKSRKTWMMMDMAASLATGNDWLGFGTHRTPVLVIDAELMPFESKRRLCSIMESRKYWDHSGVHLLSLRGCRIDFDALRRKIMPICEGHGIGAIFLDPFYRLSKAEENSNNEVADFLCGIEEMAVENDAAVVFAHHFAKGNASGKNSIDRMSGAGAFARDPDCVMSLTELEASTTEHPAFLIEPTVRSFAPVKPFAVRWDFPVWQRDESISLELKAAGGRPKGEQAGPEAILDILKGAGEELCASDIVSTARDEYGLIRRFVFANLKALEGENQITKRKEGKKTFYSLSEGGTCSA